MEGEFSLEELTTELMQKLELKDWEPSSVESVALVCSGRLILKLKVSSKSTPEIVEDRSYIVECHAEITEHEVEERAEDPKRLEKLMMLRKDEAEEKVRLFVLQTLGVKGTITDESGECIIREVVRGTPS